MLEVRKKHINPGVLTYYKKPLLVSQVSAICSARLKRSAAVPEKKKYSKYGPPCIKGAYSIM